MAMKQKLSDNTTELRAFLGYAFIVLQPGAEPPRHPQRRTTPATLAPDAWNDDEYRAYVDEARRDMDSQQAAIRDIRARAQIVLTTSLIIAAAIVGSFGSKADLGALAKVLYALAAILTGLTALATGGIITAKSTVGAPNLEALVTMETGQLHKRMADEYAATRHQGAATVAMLVTVLRYCVLVMLLGAGMLGAAYILA